MLRVNDPSGFAFKLGFTLLHVHNYAVIPPLPCTDDMRMHSHPDEVIETGYFGEEVAAVEMPRLLALLAGDGRKQKLRA